MRLPYDIVCIDIETTDTNSNLGDIIQLGAVLVNTEFKIIDSFNIYIKPLTSHRNKKAMEINGISEEILSTAYSLENALSLFENFCGKTRMLAAWGNYFDIDFLKAAYTKIRRDWTFGYKSIDLKSIAIWEFAKHDLPVVGGVTKCCERLAIPFEGHAHDGLADIKNTIRILQKLLSYDYSPHKKGWNV